MLAYGHGASDRLWHPQNTLRGPSIQPLGWAILKLLSGFFQRFTP